MHGSSPDVNDTLEYRAAAEIARLLPTGLVLIFCVLFIYVLSDPDLIPAGTIFGLVLCLVAGFAVIGVALWTRSSPGKPLFALTPAGIRYRVPLVKEVLIPWREVQGVDTIDVHTATWSMNWHTRVPRRIPLTFRNVTVILVSRQFYDTHLHIKSFFLRGPGWNANFLPKGDLMQVAFHHELLSVDPQALRLAVETRWLAFRNDPPPPRTSVPSIGAVGAIDPPARSARGGKTFVMGDDPRAITRWEATKIALPLIGIIAVLTNMAALWNMPGQAEEREKFAKVRAERKYWDDRMKQIREETKRRDAEQKQRRQELDDLMRRTFGR